MCLRPGDGVIVRLARPEPVNVRLRYITVTQGPIFRIASLGLLVGLVGQSEHFVRLGQQGVSLGQATAKVAEHRRAKGVPAIPGEVSVFARAFAIPMV